MKISFKKSIMFMLILLALTFSALGVTPALADDGVTPPTDAPVVEQPVADTPVVDAPVVDAPAAEEPIVADAPAVEQPAAEEPAAEAATVSEILEAAPEGTEVVVLDESGEALPLASTEAAEVLASGDPYFWDGTQYVGYTTGTCPAIVTLCNVVSAPIQAAVDAFAASSSATGEIFVAAGTYNEDVSIDAWGNNLANLSGLIGVGSGTTTINGYLEAYGFTNPFTLSGFTFTNSVYIDSSSDVFVDDVVVDGSTSGLGMDIYSSGNVELNNVSVTNSYWDGAQIYANGDVTINDSVFSSNGHVESYSDSYSYPGYWYSYTNQYGTGSGLEVETSGNVALDNVSVSGNYGDGAEIYTDGSAVITNSQFDSNGSTYNNSQIGYDSWYGNYTSHSEGGEGSGLSLEAYAGATLDSVSASGNHEDGASIYSHGTVDIIDSQFNSNGTTGNFDEFTADNSIYNYSDHYDSGNGIFLSGNAFTLTNVTASDNVLDGVSLKGGGGGKPVIGGSGTTGNATITCSTFENNGGYGVNSGFSGTLNLNNVTFNGNTAGDYSHKGTVNVSDVNCNPVPTAPEVHAPADDGTDKKEQTLAPLYVVIEQVQGQLPATLGEGFKFGSALKVELTKEGKDVTDLAITLSFPIPADMKDASLVVMFWNGSAWVEVSGGSVVNGFYVITVNQPGEYVLAAK